MNAIAAAWLLSVGFDFLLHAGVLASMYARPSPFLLDARQALTRIPLGYLAFFVLTWALAWLMHRLGVRSALAGLWFGAKVGATTWGAFVLGLYSISTIDPALAVGWWAGQTLELGLAGAVLGAASGGASMRRTWILVATACAVCVVLVLTLQAAGLAPPMERR